MKIVLLSNHAGILPAMDYFNAQGWLQAVISTDKLASYNLQIADYCDANHIKHLKVSRRELQTSVTQLFRGIQPDLVIMLGFSYRIPQDIYTIPKLGFYNIHFSLLPAYRGSDPIFWQIKNGEQTGGITIHRVDQNFDTGEIVMQQQIPFMKGETSGICNNRYAAVAFEMIKNLTAALTQNGSVPGIITHGEVSYFPKQTPADLMIDWESDTAGQIENLVNATNPSAGGAATLLRGQLVNILEVSPVDALGQEGIKGGTVVHADASGLYVQCSDRKILRINILKMQEGFLTGFKLAALGVGQGDCFVTPAKIAQLVVN